MEASIFIGIQATGKTTFYRQHFFDTHLRINLDMLKTRHRESRLFRTCLEIGQPFVVDNTNPTKEDRRRYLPAASAAGFKVTGYYFQSRLAEALKRNDTRPEAKRIPAKGIGGSSSRLELPSYDEGFDDLFYVRIGTGGGFVVEGWRG